MYRAIWDSATPVELFASSAADPPEHVRRVMDNSLQVVRDWANGSTRERRQPLSETQLRQLGDAGYWGLLTPREYGGSGASLRDYASFLTRMAVHDSSVANLLSVHACLGPAGVLKNFGSPQQQQKWLPLLAGGERIGVFAMTEPGAGSDLTAIATQAVREGDAYGLSGSKAFITNLRPGRVAAIVCRIDARPALLIAQLPDETIAEVEFVEYPIHAARRSGNRGMRLRNFRVTAGDLVQPEHGDGLTIAYFGLNRGRMSLCAVTAGTLRRILAGMVAWVKERQTYGQPLAARQLVQRRIGRLASLIVGCDALAAWCATLLDQGFRGELECIVAKIFAADAIKEAAVELGLRTYGGRTFLEQNPIGDSLHDLLAPTIYEGEGEILSLALLRAIAKGQAAVPHPPSDPNAPSRPIAKLDHLADEWQPPAEWAFEGLKHRGEAVRLMLAAHGDAFLDEQCEAVELSRQIQQQTTVACLAAYASRQTDATTQAAAAALAKHVQREVDRRRPTADDFRREADLGRRIIEASWVELADVPVDRPVHPFDA